MRCYLCDYCPETDSPPEPLRSIKMDPKVDQPICHPCSVSIDQTLFEYEEFIHDPDDVEQLDVLED